MKLRPPSLDPTWKYPGLSEWLEEERQISALLGLDEIDYYLVGFFVVVMTIGFVLAFGFVLGWL